MVDITQLDLYALLGVKDETCSIAELTTAFRKKALTCHPDKFPDDPEKKEIFLQIKKALELLTDKPARAAYDACRKQKKIHQERLSQMDDKRKKFKQTLEQNEQRAWTSPQANVSTSSKTSNDAKLRAEVERLRREGSRLVIEELERLHNMFEQQQQQQPRRQQQYDSNGVHLVIKYAPNSTPYSADELHTVFDKYGRISTIVNTSSKRALIEFANDHISTFVEDERGLDGRPFASVKIQRQNVDARPQQQPKRPAPSANVIDLTKPDFEDYEAIMLKKMSQQTGTS